MEKKQYLWAKDLAVSLYHQGDNIDRDRLRRLTGAPEPSVGQGQKSLLRVASCAWISRPMTVSQCMF